MNFFDLKDFIGVIKAVNNRIKLIVFILLLSEMTGFVLIKNYNNDTVKIITIIIMFFILSSCLFCILHDFHIEAVNSGDKIKKDIEKDFNSKTDKYKKEIDRLKITIKKYENEINTCESTINSLQGKIVFLHETLEKSLKNIASFSNELK